MKEGRERKKKREERMLKNREKATKEEWTKSGCNTGAEIRCVGEKKKRTTKGKRQPMELRTKKEKKGKGIERVGGKMK
jgi:hypothetical protein